MSTPNERLTLRDWLRFDFLRQLSRILLLFFPAILFLFLVFFCFWKITQGRDLMIITIVKPRVFGFFIVAIFFWCYVTWYTSRVVAKAKDFQTPSSNPIWTRLRIQFPRLLAFTGFTIVILAYFQLPYQIEPISYSFALCLLAASFIYYVALFRLFEYVTTRPKQDRPKYLRRLRDVTWLTLAALFVMVFILQSIWSLIVMLFALQAGLTFQLVIRRKLLEALNQSFHQKTVAERGFSVHSKLGKKIKGLLFDTEDRVYFYVFLGVFIVALAIYVISIHNVDFAIYLGSFPFVFLAFGMLLIFGNIVAFFSVLFRFNLHVLIILFALIIGSFNDPHYTRLPDKQDSTALYSQRQGLSEYFYRWVNDSTRRKALESDTVSNYPVYFVLANGGASRSGYWVASVLAQIEAETNNKFSKHLFCLSGASGGSVGNATFYSLLRSKKDLELKDSTASSYLNITRDYLESDFLTFTLARMLGPDVFRHIDPLSRRRNRADALSTSLEKAPGKDNFLYDSMSVGFSRFMTQTGKDHSSLPILCINTTRMQDGAPGVITTIKIGNNAAFNDRIDVLGLIDEKKDLKLSSGVVLGASFPYVSPAGRIDYKRDDTTKMRPQYFVDGGYFDNSGAGVVNEMIIALNAIINKANPSLKGLLSKLSFHVLHITNDPEGFESKLPKVNPLVNDLAAPIKTLIGAYGTQTSVNDLRLKNYIKSDPGKRNTYRKFPLYRYQDSTITYSMNWVISGYLLKAMNDRLEEKQIKDEIAFIKNELK